MSDIGRALRLARLSAGLSLAAMAKHTHYSKPYLGLIETSKRPASSDVVRAYESVLGVEGISMDRRSFIAAVALAPLGGRYAENDPEMLDRITQIVRSPQRTDGATLATIAEVLAHTRRLEDTTGVAAVMPSIQHQIVLVDHLLAGSRMAIRERVAALSGEMHQCAGWLHKASGDSPAAHHHLDHALALGVEIDAPDLTSMALSFKGTTALDDGDSGSAVALSRAAVRDDRVFIAQKAYNAFQEARGHGAVGDVYAVECSLGKGEELAQRAVEEQRNAPPGQYWYGAGFFTVQRGLAWHSLRDPRYARRAADDLDEGIRALPENEQGAEWAARFHLSAAEAYADAGSLERATDAALRALEVARLSGSSALRTMVGTLRDELANQYDLAAVRTLTDVLND